MGAQEGDESRIWVANLQACFSIFWQFGIEIAHFRQRIRRVFREIGQSLVGNTPSITCRNRRNTCRRSDGATKGYLTINYGHTHHLLLRIIAGCIELIDIGGWGHRDGLCLSRCKGGHAKIRGRSTGGGMGVINKNGILLAILQVDGNRNRGIRGCAPGLVRINVLTTHNECPETFCNFWLADRTFFGTTGYH